MMELKQHQYANLFHIFIVAPLIFLAIYPRYLSKINVNPDMFVKFMTGLLIIMLVFHVYRFVSGFEGLMGMFSPSTVQQVTVVPTPAPAGPEPAPVAPTPEAIPEPVPEVKPEEQGPVPMEGFSMF